MHRTVLYLVINSILFVQSVPDYENINYNIQINIPISRYLGNHEINQTFVVLKDKPFNITLQDYLSAGIICISKRYSYFITNYVEVIKNGFWYSVIKVPRAKESMSTEWKCTIGRQAMPDQIITFKVRVKGKPKIKVTVGDLELRSSLSESTELEYDNIAYYWYEDGETIDLVCVNMNVGFLYIEYLDPSGTKLIETDKLLRRTPPNFQKIMRLNDNNHILDCKYQLYEFHNGYAYRTIFKARTEASRSDEQEESLDVRMFKKELLIMLTSVESNHEDADKALANFKEKRGPAKPLGVYSTRITINNLKLVPINVSAHGHIEYYRYKFFENQVLEITCEKNKDLDGELLFGKVNNKHLKSKINEEIQNVSWKKTILLETKDMILEYLRCDVVGHSTANVTLRLNTRALYITGLNVNNVMYEYINDSTTWIMNYQYTVNETLDLTCLARVEGDLRLIFGNNSVSETINSKNISNIFTLQEEHNEMKLICEGNILAQKQRVIVNLQRVDKKENILFNISPAVYTDDSDEKPIFVVLEKKPFNITLINYNATDVRCCHYYNKGNCFPITLQNVPEEQNADSIIMVSESFENMSTIWECTIMKHGFTGQKIVFNLRVKGPNNLNVTVRGVEQKANKVNSTELRYDAISYYWYEVGELIDLDCTNLHVGGTIRLSYHGNGRKLFETDSLWQFPINFRKVMNADSDGDIIDCAYKTVYFNYEYTHRVVFKIKANYSSNRLIGIDINNSPLIPVAITNSTNNIYLYKYYEGQNLMVSCEKDKHRGGHLQFETSENRFLESSVCEEKMEVTKDNMELWRKTIRLNTKHINEQRLSCNVTNNHFYSTANIMFVLENKELYILGLPTSDMLYQYNKNRSTLIFGYKHKERNPVDLTCVARSESNIRWNFPNTTGKFFNSTKSIKHRLLLRPGMNQFTFSCEAIDVDNLYTQSVIVNLHKERSLEISGGDDVKKSEETTSYNIIVIISFSVGTLVSILGISFVCYVCFKEKDAGDNDNQHILTTNQSRPLPAPPRLQRQLPYHYDYVYSTSITPTFYL